MKDCERYELMISALLDGELDEREKAELSAHIAGCEHCAALATAFAAATGALAEDLEEPPAGLHDAVMEKIATAAKVKRDHTRFMRLRPIIAAAACVAVVAVTLFAANRGIRNAESTDTASGSNDEIFVTAPEVATYAGGAGGSAVTTDGSADIGGESGNAAPKEAPVPDPAMDGDATEVRSVTDATDDAAPEEAAEDSTAVMTDAEKEADVPAGLPTLEVEAVAVGDGSFTATVVADPGGYFAPGTTLTVLSDEAASPSPGTRMTVRYSGISFGAQPGVYYVTAEELEISE